MKIPLFLACGNDPGILTGLLVVSVTIGYGGPALVWLLAKHANKTAAMSLGIPVTAVTGLWFFTGITHIATKRDFFLRLLIFLFFGLLPFALSVLTLARAYRFAPKSTEDDPLKK